MSYGLTTTGFVPKPLSVIRAELNAAVQSAFGASVDVSDNSPLGQLLGIKAEREALLWELAEASAATLDPDSATQAALDALCALTGTTREPASASGVTLTLTGTPTTAVAIGSVAEVTGTGDRFETTAAGTITAVSAHADSTAYAVGDRVTSGGHVYRCKVAGTSGTGTPPTSTTFADDTDGGVTWRWLGEGTGAIDVAAISQSTGPIVAVSETLTEIVTPVSGWTDVVNILDADLGSAIETDADLRVRREIELASGGKGPVDPIIAALYDVAGVTAVELFVNRGNETDGDGVPPKSFEALISGGSDQDLWDVILANGAAGIEAHGDEIGTATDSEGNDHTVAFSRPTDVDIYVAVTLEYFANDYPADGDDQIKAAIVAWGDARGTGYDAVSSAIKGACFSVPGVLDVSVANIGTSASPTTETTIAINNRQLAKYDTSRITVASSAGMP